MAMILSTERLSKRFGDIVATENVSLDIQDGELRCIIGPNGAGKSTLFALLCGIHRPDAGRILLKGKIHAPVGFSARAPGCRAHFPD